MSTVEVVYRSIGRDEAVVNLGDENHVVEGGAMIPFKLDRQWVGDHYEPYIVTPANDGKHTVNLGGGDDLLYNSSGDDVIDGGAGFDMISFQEDPLKFTEGSWEFDPMPIPPYSVTVNLAAGTAVWDGPEVTDVREEAIFDDGSIIGYQKYEFALGKFGSFNHSLSGVEAVRGSKGNDTMFGSDAALELFDLSDNGQDTVDGVGGIDWVAYGKFTGILFMDGTAVHVDLAAKKAETPGEFISPDIVTAITSQLAGIENVLGSAADDVIAGDDGDNVIDGGFGDDKLDGRDGRDTLSYEMDVSAAIGRVLEYSRESRYGSGIDKTAGITANLDTGIATDTDGNKDTVSNFEDISGTSRKDSLTGDDGGNTLRGLDGEDSLDGGGGDDRLEGGDGKDRLTGGDGKDTFVDPKGGDVLVDFQFGQDSIKFLASGSGQSLGRNPDMIIGDVKGLLNSVGADLIFKDELGETVFEMQDGLTNLLGYFQTSLFQDAGELIQGTDAVDDLTGTAGSDTIVTLALADIVSGAGGDDLIAGGMGNDKIHGDAGGDDLAGGDGADEMDGGSENDTLLGDGGNDTLKGDAGDDRLDGGFGSDTMFGGAGKDTFVISYENGKFTDRIGDYGAGDTIDLSIYKGLGYKVTRSDLSIEKIDGRLYMVNVDLPGGGEPVNAFSVVLGKALKPAQFLHSAEFLFADKIVHGIGDLLSNVNDVLKGKGLDDLLSGLKGGDLLQGLGGDDRIEGGVGDDTLDGGDGDDKLDGGTGNDKLDGGNDDDVLEGGAGNDKLGGGAGNDRLIGGIGKDVLDGGDGDDILVATGGIGRLIGGAGEDIFMITRDALKSLSTLLEDFNHDEDRIILDGVELDEEDVEVVDDEIDIVLSGAGKDQGIFKFDLWGELFGSE